MERTETPPRIEPAHPSGAVRPIARGRSAESAGVEGNERLTGVTGALLLALLAALGVTILRIGQLISAHMFIGLILVGPLALKLASTGYRVASYYLGRSAYVRKGPPWTPLRLLAGPVVLLTALVMVSGVVLMFIGPAHRSTWLLIHKASFVLWLGATALHVVAHLFEVGDAVRLEYGPAGPRLSAKARRGRSLRLALLVGSVGLGVVLALLAVPQFSPWAHFHGGGG